MPKYQVHITGTLDDNFEVEANDAAEASRLAEIEFKEKHVFIDGVSAIGASKYALKVKGAKQI